MTHTEFMNRNVPSLPEINNGFRIPEQLTVFSKLQSEQFLVNDFYNTTLLAVVHPLTYAQYMEYYCSIAEVASF